MSQLDDILDIYGDDPKSYSTPELQVEAAKSYLNNEQAKRKIKDLMLEIIGTSDLAIVNFPGLTNDNMARNGLRNELRQKVEEL